MSRRIRTTTFIVLMLAGLVAAFQAWWTWSGGEVHGERVIVSRVYDGDTIVVGRGWRATTVRLIGVDTPETVHPDKPVEFYGPEASDFTHRSLAGRWVRIETEPDRPGGEIDRYGRLLGYVYTEDGRNFNLELIRRGYGRAYTRFPFRYEREFREAEQKARADGIGLWAQQRRRAQPDAAAQGRIIGNSRSRIYHLPGQYGYDKVAAKNRVYFDTEEEAQQAGYRKAKR